MTNKINKNSGQTMILVVIFFVFITTAVMYGLMMPSVREFSIAGESIKSKKSYFLAESGIEDVIYRILTNKAITTSETITLDSNSVTTTVASVNNSEKIISSLGDVSNYQRKVGLSLKARDGVVFKFGTQAGRGGLVMSNNAGIHGSIYSNGDISGSNGSFVTGDAFVADPPALYANQSNGESGNPPYSIIVGKTSNQDFAQSFQVTETSKITKFQIYIKKVGFPSNAYIKIYEDNNGKPYADPYAGHLPIAGGTIYAGGIATFYSWFDVSTYSANAMLIPGVTYWLVVDCQNSQSSNYYVIGANQLYPNGYGLTGIISPSVIKGSWIDTNPSQLDMYFKIFFGGGHGFISNVDVGTNGTGDSNVYTLTNSTVAGNAYCKTGTGNNKSCDTSQDIPEPEEMPISDSMINGWKADAEDGGTIDGDLTISGTQTLGPKKINGNLTITGTVTITNTIWVTGNINISGTVKLNPSYLATSGIIISDKYIYIANNSVFQDSGVAGSYIMVLSTSFCDSMVGGNPCGAYNAIEVKNNSNLIIANAQKGAVAFQNNAGVKEVVANRIYLANNSTVSYGTGLMNVNFTSGTSGVWDIDNWKETE